MVENKQDNISIIIAGGGSGGHLFPGIAVAEEVMSRFAHAKILFVTGGRSIESRVFAGTGFRQKSITVEGIKGRGWKAVRAVFKLPCSLIQSFRIIRSEKPGVVLGVGGYSSGPVVLAAWLMNIPTAIHEQNSYPGFANRMLCRFCDRVFISFEESRKCFPSGSILLTGNPVRKEFLLKRRYNKGEEKDFTILVTGGSQGARAVNSAVINALVILKQKGLHPYVIHHSGPGDSERVRKEYEERGLKGEVVPFIGDMAEACERSDFFIGRAGAGTVFELAAMGKPSVLIPYPNSPNGHQESNAMALANTGGSIMINQESSENGEVLADIIIKYMKAPSLLKKMGEMASTIAMPDATKIIADELCGMINLKKQK